MATVTQRDIAERVEGVERERTVYDLTLTPEEATYIHTLLRGTYGRLGWGLYNPLTDAMQVDVFDDDVPPVQHSGEHLVTFDGEPFA